MDQLKVDIDMENCCIKIMNNGRGLPIEIHKEHKIYIPEMVFGHLLTSDNYNDQEKKVTGGRNGYGAKLANIFSTKFVVSTADSSRGLKYRQVFEKNMSAMREAKIDKYAGDDYTEVTFYPDMTKFGMPGLDLDIVSLMMKRVYDIAGAIGEKCKVYLNGKRLPVKGFKDYCELYLKSFGLETPVPRVHEKVNDRWEIVISLSDPKEGCGQFQQVSFVNSICTTKGGTHVNHVVDKFVPKLLEKVESKNRGGMKPQPFHIKNHLWVFINCLVENPSFDSQTKETLTTKVSQFGSDCAVSDACLAKVLKIGIVEQVVNWIKSKQDQNINKLVKTTGNVSRILGIPKLEDANDAGTKNGDKCTLILTEGDSAKALAVAGLGVVGRDRFGVFPLRGKLLNVRDATYSQTVENKEVQALMKIVGIDPSKQYSSAKGLRYGSVMLMTDQDHDGSHIKGLLINMMHHWWPSLCQLGGFLKEFVTPIVKVTNSGGDVIEFFTMTEYEHWKRLNNDGKGWKVKYYKGLGTSTAKEAREYFSAVDKHRIGFVWKDDQDGESIDMAFNKKRADDRKEWINGYEDGVCVDHRVKELRYSDFINKELVQFSKYDVMRSIPSVVDGLKPGQRKVLFCAFKRNLRSDVKVAQFIGYVSEQSAYHHGEQSLESTIVGMAQDFVGSNNFNLLFPSGQFGTRLQGGKDAASGRYIYTRLSGGTRKIFSSNDDALLTYQTEEGQRIEPKWYCPVIPMVLVNGAEGIGTGWSTNVPCYDPKEIVVNLRNLLRGKPLVDMLPAYRGFTGEVESNGKGGFEFSGKIRVLDDGSIEISELPVRVWTQNYKEFLQELLVDYVKEEPPKGKGKDKGKGKGKEKAKAAPAKKKKKADGENVTPNESDLENSGRKIPTSTVQIKDFKEYHTEHAVRFRIEISNDMLAKAESLGLEKVFKLRSTMGTSNMVLFDPNGKIRKYETALEILEEFAALRIELYVKRKNYLISKLAREIEIAENKRRFVRLVVSGQLQFANKKAPELVKEMRQHGVKSMLEIEAEFKIAATDSSTPDDASDDESSDVFSSLKAGFDYLLGMPLWNLTAEKVAQLEAELAAKAAELTSLKATSPEQMWDSDLVEVLVALEDRDAEDAKDRAKAKKQKQIPDELMDGERQSDDLGRKGKHRMDGEIVTVDIKPLEAKPQVWRKKEVLKEEKQEKEEKRKLESIGKSLGVSETSSGSLLERLLRKQRESGEQQTLLDLMSKKPEPMDLEPIKVQKSPPKNVSKIVRKPISPKPVRSKQRSASSSGESLLSSSESGSDVSSDSSGSSSSSGSVASSPARGTPPRKAGVAARKRVAVSSESDASEKRPKKRAAPAKKSARPTKKPTQPTKKSSSSDSEDSEDEDSFVSSDSDDSDY